MKTDRAARLLTALFLLGALLPLAAWWDTAALASEVQGWMNAVTALGRLTGLFAGYVALAQLILMARIPVIEKSVGLPRITSWHRVLGGETVALLVAHVGLITYGYSLRHNRSFGGEFVHVVATYPAMLRGLIAGLLFLMVGLTSVRYLRRVLHFEVWWLLHLGAYAGLLLSVAHSLQNGEEFVRNPGRRFAYAAVVIAAFAALLWWRVVVPLRNSWAHRVVIDAIDRETDDTVSVWLAGDGIEHLEARGGQYIVVRFLTRKHWLSGHPYSLSTPVTDGRLRITIRALGDHSTGVAELPVGTKAVVEGPFGVFTSKMARAETPALLIGGGAGVTPLRPIAEELRAEGRDVVVVLRGQNDLDLILRAEFAALDITLHELVGKRADLGFDPLEPSRLAALVPDIAERDVWVCGPDGMTWAAVQACRANDVPDNRIHLEEFAL